MLLLSHLVYMWLLISIAFTHFQESASEIISFNNTEWLNDFAFDQFQNESSKLSRRRHARQAVSTSTPNPNMTTPSELDKPETEWVGDIPFPINTLEDNICTNCPEEWRTTEVTTDWNWIWAENARHNFYRRMHGSPDLIVNLKICKCAQLWVNKLGAKQGTGHSGYCLENGIGGGGNIKSIHPDNPASGWWSEIQWWDFDKGTSISPYNWEPSGHFIQVVWPGHKYHCTAYIHTEHAGAAFGQYDGPPTKGRMLWLYPPVTDLEQLLSGSGTLNGSGQCILFLLMIGAIGMIYLA